MADSSRSLLLGRGTSLDRPNVESIDLEPVDTSGRLDEIRRLLAKDNLSYYIIPSEDPHQLEHVSANHRRVEWISGFTGNQGQAIITKLEAYVVTDSRYCLGTQEALSKDWNLIRTGTIDGPKDWIDWLVGRANNSSRIGIDARMISHEKFTILNTQLAAKSSKLVHPSQNFVDLIWKDKPQSPKEPIFIQPFEFTGKKAAVKLSELRSWIKEQPQMHVAMLITSLSSIAYLLNLRGMDTPFNAFFEAYFFISSERAILFTHLSKVTDDARDYLTTLGVEWKEYNDLWSFLKRGEGEVLIPPQAPYAVSLMLTQSRYTITPSIVDEAKAIKNAVEIEGMHHAHFRDGASFVQWFAWLEDKLSQDVDITEYEAAWRLTEYRRRNIHYWELSQEIVSASGPNGALQHYSPTKSRARMIDCNTPYLIDSGAHYRDGTCKTARTAHFGRPTPEQSEAYTRVLQGHIAIVKALFPEGTKDAQLQNSARRALDEDAGNYVYGTVQAFVKVQDRPTSSSNPVALVPGHIITCEHGFYLQGKWGIRIGSALVVKYIKTKGDSNGNVCLGFGRFDCVPIQTRMVKEHILSKEEKQWLKDYNQWCQEQLEPFLADDKRALKWLRNESDRAADIASSGPLSKLRRLT